ncbi:NarK family nitrate/nitrite MFS transporter [Undibacterium oligocarboniphilum]|uniref:Nitrate/nitrite transporter n=1 Tax=Undibacterium oligocarboniphilum TaxID=666702 RepID=A0A850QBF6_9BURK|nr:NarK family nitrate/nitrite MFS transporter [Undibacterium oligocarboniphilum]MBC3868931.1 NarK family nitrate/nitrite MFS transporter [Undibacterium oligocarboniphilum]NVO76911.1 NarK family nitrate/nitrite MFS transporter [Undibacterium oligocarboniphilum]
MSYVLSRWEPENTEFWNKEGSGIANRNLWISIPCLMLAFSVWMLWSVVAANLDKAGFQFTKDQLFFLTALPALSGATLRIFYSFLVPVFGGRKWTAISTATLLIPAIGMGFALKDPTTSYSTLLVLALLCGFGGGNFSSSMANISFFFPKTRKGYATGMNAGIGNLGVSVVQFLTPLVISSAMFGAAVSGDGFLFHNAKTGADKMFWLANAGFIWVPFITVATLAAWFGMNDIASAKASFADQAVIFKRKHNWLMCWLYIGTFGSFIGFSAGFAMLIKAQFPEIDVAKFAFLGPLAGALARPVGGMISDKIGGARLTFWVFVAMAATIVLGILPALHAHQFMVFLASFIGMFILTGLGNGSTFCMIPLIFQMERERAVNGKGEAALKQARLDAAKESAAVLGFSGAIGAYGGFFIPQSFGTSIKMTGTPDMALYTFVAFYVSCMVITWWYYSRKGAEMPC